jgi:hypothetical protein
VEVETVNDAADGAKPVRALPWDLDGLQPAELEAAYTRLAHFVERLRGLGIVVPTCWYWHRPLLPWFLAIQGWYEQVTDSGNPRTMAEWWASTWSITGSRRRGGRSPHDARRRPESTSTSSRGRRFPFRPSTR